jgi:hypothetical protein
VQLTAFNGGSASSTVSATCDGQSRVQITVAARQQNTLITNWAGTCSTVSIGSSNGLDTSFDNLVLDAG